MSRIPRFAFALLLLAGCHSALTPDQKAANTLKALHSDRLKRHEVDISPLTVLSDGSVRADGIWVREPDAQGRQLVFPEQTTIICNKGAEYCLEMKISFVTVGDITSVKGPEETLWPIKSWNKDSLLAEYDPVPVSISGPDKCQKHVLSIVIASETVTTSDIPSHGPGCDEFRETNSYRLASGYYDVDTSPRNDAVRDTSAK